MTTLLVKKTYLRINVKSVKLVDEIKLLLSDLHCSAEDQCEETSGVNGDHLHFNYLNISCVSIISFQLNLEANAHKIISIDTRKASANLKKKMLS